jgi:hypothetical protein
MTPVSIKQLMKLIFILFGTEVMKNIASWYKSYGIVGCVLFPTYKICPAGAIFEFWRTTAHQQQKVLYHVCWNV